MAWPPTFYKLQSLLGPALTEVFYQDRRIADLASGKPAKRNSRFTRGVFTSFALSDAQKAARKLSAGRLPSQIPESLFAEVIVDWLQGVQLPQQLHPDFADDRTMPHELAVLCKP